MTDAPDSTVPRRAVYSVRDAMRRAGVPNWEMGGGVSSADAIDYIAKQRDRWKWLTLLFISLGIVQGLCLIWAWLA